MKHRAKKIIEGVWSVGIIGVFILNTITEPNCVIRCISSFLLGGFVMAVLLNLLLEWEK